MLAEGESGPGRMAEPLEIVAALEAMLGQGPLTGRHVIVTSGPTYEPIDPVRFIGNRSSGKQGHAIAAALAKLGARVTLVSGPVALPDPANVTTIRIESARQMQAAVLDSLPADAVICAAAVADWTVSNASSQKRKKQPGQPPPAIELTPNPDILAGLCQLETARPALVIGFAAETEHVIRHATEKRQRKGCDWIIANDVSPETGTFGGDQNRVHIIDDRGCEDWPLMNKTQVAERLAQRLADHLAGEPS